MARQHLPPFSRIEFLLGDFSIPYHHFLSLSLNKYNINIIVITLIINHNDHGNCDDQDNHADHHNHGIRDDHLDHDDHSNRADHSNHGNHSDHLNQDDHGNHADHRALLSC